MIYLIDDSPLKELNAEYVFDEKYASILKLIKDSEEFHSHKSQIGCDDCILVHKTFMGSQIVKEEMSQLSDDGEFIPIAIFSDGDSENADFDELKKPHYIGGLKKPIFYERLRYFLDYYLANHLIDFQIIAYGNDYIKENVRRWALSVLKKTNGNVGIMGLMDLSKVASCPEFKKLIQASSPAIGISYESLIEHLEDNPITFESFKYNISRIVTSFNQYGKNIYSWGE